MMGRLNNIKNNSTNAAKSAQLDLLKELKKICKENDLQYFLQYGTLIGAVRHNGFIPWDDDIDVGMLREDYEKFRECCKKQLNNNFYLADYRDTENYPHVYGKLKIKNTKYVETLSKNSTMGNEIFIDIFPYDNAPDSKFMRRARNIKYKIYKRVLELKCGFGLANTFKRKIKYFPIIVLSKLLTTKHCINVFDKGLSKYNNKETKYVANCGSPAAYKDEVLPKEYISKVKLHKYEDSEFSIPVEYDKLLRIFYGDYMQLPPIEERVGKHKIIEMDLGNYKPKSKVK